MSTHAPTLTDLPADLRETVEAFAAGFLTTVTDRDQITAGAVGAALEREAHRVAVVATNHRHPTRDAMLPMLSGTYDEFRAVEGLAEGELLHTRR